MQGLFGEMRMTLENFRETAGIDVTHVPYNSGAQAIIDLLSDRLDAMFLVIPPIKQHVETGKLVALATLNATRVAALPNIPTMAELGRPEMTGTIWFGYLAPAKTPDATMAKLVRAFQTLKSDQALKQRVIEMGAELDLTGPAEFGKIIDEERRRYGRIVAGQSRQAELGMRLRGPEFPRQAARRFRHTGCDRSTAAPRSAPRRFSAVGVSSSRRRRHDKSALAGRGVGIRQPQELGPVAGRGHDHCIGVAR